VKKLMFLVAFVGSAAVGGACNQGLKQACEDFVAARNSCEDLNGDPPPIYGFNLCENIDEDCEEFYNCAASAPCEENKSDGKFRLQAGKVEGCVQPENKECTDADLRM
jgi:hypothetical protein